MQDAFFQQMGHMLLVSTYETYLNTASLIQYLPATHRNSPIKKAAAKLTLDWGMQIV